MNGIGVILLSTAVTIAAGAAAVLSLGTGAERAARVAQSLGAAESSRRTRPTGLLLAPLRPSAARSANGSPGPDSTGIRRAPS